MSADKMIKVTLRRSGIGTSPRQRLTLRGLGLKRVGRSVIVKDSAAVRGMMPRATRFLRES